MALITARAKAVDSADSASRAGLAKSPAAGKTRARDADGMAVASFVFGLMGLLVGNLLLGPTAIVLGALALRGGTARQARAWSGIGLGVADLIVIAALTAIDGTLSWSI